MEKKLVAVLFLLWLPCASIAEVVRVGILSPLDTGNSEYSERFRYGFQSSLFYKLGTLRDELNSCGYSIELDFRYYSHDNLLQAKELATKFESDNAWILLGPNRSNHFLIATKGLKAVPMVSALASSTAVYALPKRFRTMSPTNFDLAKRVYLAVQDEEWGDRFVVALDQACISCRDFAKQFTKVAGKNGQWFQISDGNLRIDQIAKTILAEEIDFIVLPNYSKLSGRFIQEISAKIPNTKFVGGDGWGDGEYGYLAKYNIDSSVLGFSTRLATPSPKFKKEIGLSNFSYAWNGSVLPPSLSSNLSAEFLDKTAKFICELKPSNRQHFLTSFEKLNEDFYRTSLPISLFELKGRRLMLAE